MPPTTTLFRLYFYPLRLGPLSSTAETRRDWLVRNTGSSPHSCLYFRRAVRFCEIKFCRGIVLPLNVVRTESTLYVRNIRTSCTKARPIRSLHFVFYFKYYGTERSNGVIPRGRWCDSTLSQHHGAQNSLKKLSRIYVGVGLFHKGKSNPFVRSLALQVGVRTWRSVSAVVSNKYRPHEQTKLTSCLGRNVPPIRLHFTRNTKYVGSDY